MVERVGRAEAVTWSKVVRFRSSYSAGQPSISVPICPSFCFSLHRSFFPEAPQAKSRTLTFWEIVNAASGQDLAMTSRVTCVIGCVSPAEPHAFVTPRPPS